MRLSFETQAQTPAPFTVSRRRRAGASATGVRLVPGVGPGVLVVQGVDRSRGVVLDVRAAVASCRTPRSWLPAQC
jgi:hypothetical protein